MFIDYLTKEEQEVFLSLSVDAALANGIFEEEQKMKVRELASRITKNEDYDVSTLQKDLNKLQRKEAKNIVLLELIGVCYSNGEYCDKERDFMKNLAQKLSVEISHLEKIEKWVEEFMVHVKKGAEIINN